MCTLCILVVVQSGEGGSFFPPWEYLEHGPNHNSLQLGCVPYMQLLQTIIIVPMTTLIMMSKNVFRQSSLQTSHAKLINYNVYICIILDTLVHAWAWGAQD